MMVPLRAYLTISQLINRLDLHMLELTARGECVLIWGGGSHLRERGGTTRGFTKWGGVHRGSQKGGSGEPCEPPWLRA